ncbi:hypothetical protein JXQ70_12505 [bacterium]|nr:hypothetical protein [bacterium]
MTHQSALRLKFHLVELWVVPGFMLMYYLFMLLGQPTPFSSLQGYLILLGACLLGYCHSLPMNWILIRPLNHYFRLESMPVSDQLSPLRQLRQKIFELPFRRALWSLERFLVMGLFGLLALVYILQQDLSSTRWYWLLTSIGLCGLLSAVWTFLAMERLSFIFHDQMHFSIEHRDLGPEFGRIFSIRTRILVILLIVLFLTVAVRSIIPFHFHSIGAFPVISQSVIFAHIFGAFLYLSIIIVVLGCFFSNNLKMSLRRLQASMIKAESGNLGSRTPVCTLDEVGQLAICFNTALKSLSEIFGKVKDVSNSVALVAERLSNSSLAMSEGIELQASSTDTTTSSMSEMQSSITEVADSINFLFNETESTSSSIMEMAASIEQVAVNIESLSNSVDTTSSSIEEMNASIKQVAENAITLNRTALDLYRDIEKIIQIITEVEQWALESSKLSNNVTQDAEKGSQAVQQTIQGMEEIHKFFQISGQVIQNFSERSEQIGSIVNVIDDVSSQTNLLALNAAIISAQAGEHGKEFAVVADEIRDLAEKATVSTKEINHLIKNAQQEAFNAVKTMEDGARLVADGVKMSHRAGDVLQLITQSSINSAKMTSQIEEATIEQVDLSREISKTIDQLKMMSDQLARATKEQKIGSSQIMREAENMLDMAQLVRNATEKQADESHSISKAVADVKKMVERIQIATNQQKSGSQSVIEAVEVFKDITLKNVDSMVEIDKAVDTLSGQVISLEDQISRFRL